jgi:hypothetical protein
MYECPDYSTFGSCRRANCKLPHIDRAGRLRQKTGDLAGGKQQDELSDLSSNEDVAEDIDYDDDVDSDDLGDELLRGNDDNDALPLADDFVLI